MTTCGHLVEKKFNSMKIVSLLTISVGLLVVASSPALAAKADGPKARLFAKYDKNKDGVINGEEKDALRKDFAADKDGELKRFDTSKNGKLEDEEIAAIKPPTGKKKADKGEGEKSGKAKEEKTDKTEKNDKTGESGKAEKTEK